METKIFKRDYKIVIGFDNAEQLMWDTKRKDMPHYVGDNTEELLMVKEACEEVITHVNRLLNEKNKR